MGSVQDGLQIGDGNTGVDLGGLQALVSEEFLDFADVGAASQEMGGKRMPEDVGGDGGLDPRDSGALMHDGVDHGLPEAASVLIEKERVLTRALHQLRPRLSQVVVEHERSAAGDGNNAVFSALAIADQEKTLAKIHVGEIDAAALGKTHARSVEHLEDGAVARAVGGPSKRRLDKPRHFRLGENESWQGRYARELQAVGGILKHQVSLHEVAKESPQGGQVRSSSARTPSIEAS